MLPGMVQPMNGVGSGSHEYWVNGEFAAEHSSMLFGVNANEAVVFMENEILGV